VDQLVPPSAQLEWWLPRGSGVATRVGRCAVGLCDDRRSLVTDLEIGSRGQLALKLARRRNTGPRNTLIVRGAVRGSIAPASILCSSGVTGPTVTASRSQPTIAPVDGAREPQAALPKKALASQTAPSAHEAELRLPFASGPCLAQMSR